MAHLGIQRWNSKKKKKKKLKLASPKEVNKFEMRNPYTDCKHVFKKMMRQKRAEGEWKGYNF